MKDKDEITRDISRIFIHDKSRSIGSRVAQCVEYCLKIQEEALYQDDPAEKEEAEK